jgi:hypothetical protein
MCFMKGLSPYRAVNTPLHGYKNQTVNDVYRGGVKSTRGLGPTMTARGQSTSISIGMLPQTDYV